MTRSGSEFRPQGPLVAQPLGLGCSCQKLIKVGQVEVVFFTFPIELRAEEKVVCPCLNTIRYIVMSPGKSAHDGF